MTATRVKVPKEVKAGIVAAWQASEAFHFTYALDATADPPNLGLPAYVQRFVALNAGQQPHKIQQLKKFAKAKKQQSPLWKWLSECDFRTPADQTSWKGDNRVKARLLKVDGAGVGLLECYSGNGKSPFYSFGLYIFSDNEYNAIVLDFNKRENNKRYADHIEGELALPPAKRTKLVESVELQPLAADAVNAVHVSASFAPAQSYGGSLHPSEAVLPHRSVLTPSMDDGFPSAVSGVGPMSAPVVHEHFYPPSQLLLPVGVTSHALYSVSGIPANLDTSIDVSGYSSDASNGVVVYSVATPSFHPLCYPPPPPPVQDSCESYPYGPFSYYCPVESDEDLSSSEETRSNEC